jgi:hypothetical protein
MNGQTKKAAALTVVLIGMLASGTTLGHDPGPCHEAYLQSGLSEQQMSFEDFRHSYSDTLCARDDLAATHGGRVPEEAR